MIFIKSIGFRFFLIYIFFTYGIQGILYNLFKRDFSITYNSTDGTIVYIFFLILAIIILQVIFNSTFPKIKGIYIGKSLTHLLLTVFTITIIFYFLASLHFFLTQDISFRGTTRMRNADAIIVLMFAITPMIKIFTFFILVYFLKYGKISKFLKFNLILILLSSILSLNSSLGIMFIALLLLLLLHPKVFTIKISFFTLLFLFIFAIIAVNLVIFIGFANKGGIDFALKFYTSVDQLYRMYGIVISRISSSFMSAFILSNNYMFDYNLQLNSISWSIETMLQRLYLMIPLVDYPNSEILTVNRLNYLIVFKDFLLTAGATPGIIATIFYTPFFPFSIFTISLFVYLIIASLNRYFKYIMRYNYLSMLSVVFLVFNFFENPLGLLIIFEPINIALLLFVGGAFVTLDQNSLVKDSRRSKKGFIVNQ